MTDNNWSLAVPVAKRVAGNYPLADTYHLAHMQSQVPGLFHQAAEMVATETGLSTPGAPSVLVVSRAEWAERNLKSFSRMLAPLEEKIAKRLEEAGRDSQPALAKRVISLETGALLGMLAKRVLGQYELVLPEGEESQGDVVALVGANVLALERQSQFRPSEFRMWIVLHEATHRAQFLGVSWLRPYFLSLIDELVGAAGPNPGRFSRLVAEMVEAGRSSRPLIDDSGLLGLLATPEQKSVIDRVQALDVVTRGPRTRGDGPDRSQDPPQPGSHVGDSQGPASRPTHRRLVPSSGDGDEDEAVRTGGKVHPVRGEGGRVGLPRSSLGKPGHAPHPRGDPRSSAVVATRRLAELTRSISARSVWPDGELVVALSGGADSAALAALSPGAVRLAHVNHGFPASPQMEAAARQIADTLGLRLAVHRLDRVPANEGVARTERYRALLADLAPGEWLLTGHTRDDQAETVLAHLLRGSGVDGLAGIPRHRQSIWRPLLDVSRSETRELATLRGLAWRDDPQNEDPRPTRNRIRNWLLPTLEAEFNPSVRDALVNAARAFSSLESPRPVGELIEGGLAGGTFGAVGGRTGGGGPNAPGLPPLPPPGIRPRPGGMRPGLGSGERTSSSDRTTRRVAGRERGTLARLSGIRLRFGPLAFSPRVQHPHFDLG